MSGLDLYLSQRTLALMFVYAALTGLGLGVVYDGLRILRMALGDPTARPPVKGRGMPAQDASGQGRRPLPLAFLLFFEDLLFMLIAAVALLLLGYYTNDGQLRGPAIVGMACGFFVYIHTVSRWVVRLADGILRLVRRVLGFCLCLLWRPLKGLWSLTAGRMMAARRERITEKTIQALTDSASRGFGILGEDDGSIRSPSHRESEDPQKK